MAQKARKTARHQMIQLVAAKIFFDDLFTVRPLGVAD
jgi:hypothetical protein